MGFLVAAVFLTLFFLETGRLLASMLEGVFGFAFSTEMRIAGWVCAYLLLASLLSWLKGKVRHVEPPWLASLHAGLSRGMWYLSGGVLAGAVALNIHGCVAARDTRIYPEILGAWQASDYVDHDYGLDSYTTPSSQRAPVVRDILSGQVLQASCRHGSGDCREILRNDGLQIDDTRDWSGRPFSVRHVRLALNIKPLGKTVITGLEYVDFNELPEQVKQSAIRKAVCSASPLTVWHMIKAFPPYRADIEAAFAKKEAHCRRGALPVL